MRKNSKGESYMTIKELRQMKGLTLAAFAKSIGIGMSTLTGYEAGKRQPGEKALAAIKEVYGVDLNETAAPVEATPTEEKAVEKKATRKSRAKKKEAAPVEASSVEAAPIEEKPAEKKAAKKPRAKKKEVAPVEAAPAAPAKEKAEKKPRAKKLAQIIIQSPMGGEITPEDILAKAGDADKIYVRVDQN